MRGRKVKVEGDYYNINNTWRIDKDKLNFFLQHKGKNEEGGEGSTCIMVGYFQTVKQLYHELVEKGIKESSLTDIKALDIKIQELHAFIEDAHAKGIMSQEK
jgi:hypothetical protein